MNTKIAIDPGTLGSIVYGTSLLDVQAVNMPKTSEDIWSLLCEIKMVDPSAQTVCLMEKVGTYMPGNSGPSAATFAEHIGELKMALIASRVPHELVLPKRWMDEFIGVQSYAKIPPETDKKARSAILTARKKERKNKIKAKAQQLFPNVLVTLNNADALGMFWYGCAKIALFQDWHKEV